MDQGIAGLAAGIAGLIGAGVGGLATAYGARIGAQKTIEAAQTQVQAQSSVDHQQWVRDQRRQACTDVFDAFSRYVQVASSCGSCVRAARALPDDEMTELFAATRELLIVSGHLELWGPDEIVAAAQEITGTAHAQHKLFARWLEAFESGDAEAMGDQAGRIDSGWESLARARTDFARAVQTHLTAHSLMGGPCRPGDSS
ncbi:hypothetical protein [Streptomyces spectabilis]|uniref:Bacterioferritin-associated ferredoxin n=1 Tax=Streptomyces spectabilis TaxID=68270 RepID=A0A5P2XBT3_STRST|nr:hypothetical protein [Streptomyces spectabilis]MBB5107813.1 bacterioferritin-associated ferredoxin [Streptomyces spectabilis]MCI3903251.1 hypothetical protein [Streptomyces spectabilis]QEV60480.1 hypothetical protein CP982_18585 [Streptomyces spectabilis]GGV38852.1 hypothetical protein GCM10010245_61590 [Streptomyces spectabilis]